MGELLSTRLGVEVQSSKACRPHPPGSMYASGRRRLGEEVESGSEELGSEGKLEKKLREPPPSISIAG